VNPGHTIVGIEICRQRKAQRLFNELARASTGPAWCRFCSSVRDEPVALDGIVRRLQMKSTPTRNWRGSRLARRQLR